MIRRPPRSTLFPTRRSSDLLCLEASLSRACRADAALYALDRWRPLAEGDGVGVRHDGLLRDEYGGGRGSKDRKSTRLNSSHLVISYAVFCLEKKKNTDIGYG